MVGAGNKGAVGGPPSAPGSGQPPWVESGLSRKAAQCLWAIWRSLSGALQGRASSGEGARASFHCEETLWKEPVATWTGAPFPAKPRPLVRLTISSPPGWPRPRPLICPGMPGCVLFSKHKPHPLWGRSSSYPQEALCLLGETDKERDGCSIHSPHHSHKDHLCSFSNIPGSL